MADDADAAGLERRAGLPGREEVGDDRVELLLRRVPGLEQVVVERDLVDGLDRGAGVGVGGEQHALGVGGDLARLDEVLGAREPGHPLVGDQQRDLVAAGDELLDDLEGLLAGGRAQHAVALAELAAQVAGHGGEDGGLVVDGDDRGSAGAFRGVCGHLLGSFSCPSTPAAGRAWKDARSVDRRGPQADGVGSVAGVTGVESAAAGADASRRATSARTTGATSVPKRSIAFRTSAWSTAPSEMWPR